MNKKYEQPASDICPMQLKTMIQTGSDIDQVPVDLDEEPSDQEQAESSSRNPYALDYDWNQNWQENW